MTTGSILPNGKNQFCDANGAPYAGGSVYFYIPNTTTPKNTWQDPGETILNTNPIILDSAGSAIIYGDGTYRQILKDSLGNTIWDQLTQGYLPDSGGTITGNLTVTGSVTTPLIIGGTAANSTLTLESTSFAANAGNTDAIIFSTSNGLTVSPTDNGPTTSLACQARFDSYGRFIMVVGQPSVSIQDSTYNGFNPLEVVNQPVGTDTSFAMVGTYTQNISANMMSLTVYADNNDAGTGGIYALQGTMVACNGTSGGGGISGTGRANVTGGEAVGLQGAALAYANSTNTTACLLAAGGDSVHPINIYLALQSQAAGNSAAWGIQIDDVNINTMLPTGTLFGNGGSHLSCAHGFYFPNATFTSDFIVGPGSAFKVDGSGNITGNQLIISAPTGNISVTSTTGTNRCYESFTNTGGSAYFGLESSAGASIFPGSAAYAGVLGTSGAHPLQFFTNDILQAQIDSGGNVIVGTAALATTATAGFLWIDSGAGAPTGAATAPYTNAAGLYYDSTNNYLYIRCGGTWRKSTAYS